LIGAAFGLGFTIGPAIAGIALSLTNNDYRVPAFIAAGFSLIAILLTVFWFKETLPAERRGQQAQNVKRGSLIANVRRALTTPVVGLLLFTIFIKQMVFGGFEQLLPLFTLSRLGLDGASNAVLFVFVGIILVLVQGRFIGPWSRRYGERKLIIGGLALLSVGLTLASVTPQQPAPWYSRDAMLESMRGGEGELSMTEGRAIDVEVPLPEDSNRGWLGLIWMGVALVPAAIGGGLVSPSINSLITKRVSKTEFGGTLGVSASLVSAANAVTPILGGAMFQFLGSTAPFLIGGLTLGVMLWIVLRRLAPGVDQAQRSAA
jgi:MFS family permease